MENYTIDLLKDLVREAWEEHSTGLPIRGGFSLFEFEGWGNPLLFYDDIQVFIHSWAAALNLYQKMRDKDNRVYHIFCFPLGHVTTDPLEYLVVAKSAKEAIDIANNYQPHYRAAHRPGIYPLKEFTAVLV